MTLTKQKCTFCITLNLCKQIQQFFILNKPLTSFTVLVHSVGRKPTIAELSNSRQTSSRQYPIVIVNITRDKGLVD